MNYAISYGDQRFVNQRQIAANSLSKFMDQVTLFTERDLAPYYPLHPKILYPGARGGGFWLYKAIFLDVMMDRLKDGDGLMWMDAGCELIADPAILFEIAQEHSGFCLFQQNHQNKRFIHRKCFQGMGCDYTHYSNDYQCDAVTMVFIKNHKTIGFLKEFLFCCSLPELITDSDGENESEELFDHRHDQSIITLLAIKNKIPRFRSPTQYGEQENLRLFLTFYERAVSALYPTLFNHCRNRF